MKIMPTLLTLSLFATACANVAVAAGDAAVGESTFLGKACAGCHGTAGNSQAPEMFPKLAGLAEDYIVTQLTAFRSGERVGTMMNQMAASLTDEDIANLAAYLSAQK